mgnify:CR=1 FL=1
MRLQLLSDLHLETESFLPTPAPQAELLVLAGDVDSTWAGLELFRGWPVPVLFVAGNHEFDQRDLTDALVEEDLATPGLAEAVLELKLARLDGLELRPLHRRPPAAGARSGSTPSCLQPPGGAWPWQRHSA